METVILKALQHKGAECIGIFSMQNATLNQYYQNRAGAKWSRTCKCWYVPCTEKNYGLLCSVLKDKAKPDVEDLKKYLLERRMENAGVAVSNEIKKPSKTNSLKTSSNPGKNAAATKTSSETKHRK